MESGRKERGNMKFITDLDEVSRILNECCGEPVYKEIGKDGDGNIIAVPCYQVGEGRRKNYE